ncbi:MotA/TolQ/ExbB proton channel family protein [bacterium]|nr:MotA/TolQ/ExbB proton channel family protein [bacterium]
MPEQPSSTGDPRANRYLGQSSVHRLTVGFERTAAIEALLTAAAAVALLYLLHTLVPDQDVSDGLNIRKRFFDSGPIPYSILYTFFFGMSYLLHVWRNRIVRLFHTTDEDAKFLDREEPYTLNQLREITDGTEKTYYYERLLRLQKRWVRDPDLAAIIAYKNEILDNDEEQAVLAFAPVRLTEWALPLLGFIGTVIGISKSMSGINEAIKDIIEAKGQWEAGIFTSAFDGLALAFDTTLLGLLGLLILGAIHAYIRKKTGDHLANARSLFSDVVAGWVEPVEPVVVKVDVSGVEARLDHFGQTAMYVIDEAKGLENVRAALYKNVVSFDKAQPAFVTDVNSFARQELGDSVRFHSFASSEQPFVSAAVVSAPGPSKPRTEHSSLIVRWPDGGCTESELSGPPPRQISLSADGRTLVAWQADEHLLKSFTLDVDAQEVTSLDDQYLHDVDDLRILAPGGHLADRLLLAYGNSVTYLECDDSRTALRRLGPRQDGATICDVAYGADSETLLTLWSSNEGSYMMVIRPSSDKQPERDGYRHPDADYVDAKRVQMVPPANIVMLTAMNQLSVWPMKGPVNFALESNDWVNHRVDALLVGRNGWLAVAQSKFLSMWNISASGKLTRSDLDGDRNDEKYALGDIDPHTLFALHDGSFVVAPSGNELIAWRFPVRNADKLTQRSPDRIEKE